MTDNPIEIPQNLRDMSERSLKQAHAGYENLTDFVTKAMGIWMGVMPTSPMAKGFKDFQDRATEIAKTNADSAFPRVEKIAKARNSQEVMLQTQFAQDRMHAFTTQTQELSKLIGDALQNSGRA